VSRKIRKQLEVPAFEQECRKIPHQGRMVKAYLVPGTREFTRHGELTRKVRSLVQEMEAAAPTKLGDGWCCEVNPYPFFQIFSRVPGQPWTSRSGDAIPRMIARACLRVANDNSNGTWLYAKPGCLLLADKCVPPSPSEGWTEVCRLDQTTDTRVATLLRRQPLLSRPVTDRV